MPGFHHTASSTALVTVEKASQNVRRCAGEIADESAPPEHCHYTSHSRTWNATIVQCQAICSYLLWKVLCFSFFAAGLAVLRSSVRGCWMMVAWHNICSMLEQLPLSPELLF